MVLQRLGYVARRIVQATALSFALTGIPAFADDHQGLLKATIEMDHQYIPVLYYTAQGDFVASEQAMQDFLSEWQAFLSVNEGYAKDPEWQHFIAVATKMVNTADEQVLSGDLMAASKSLAGIRITLQGLRERNGINDYFLDELHRYHSHMQAIVAAGDTDGMAMSQEAVRTVQKHWAEVWPRWEKIRRHFSQAKFDQEMYNFSDDRLVELKQAVAEEQVALYQLKFALINGDPKRIANAATGLTPGFERTYRAFGDMPFE